MPHEVFLVSSNSSDSSDSGPSARLREVRTLQREIPNWPTFQTRTSLKTKFSIQKNYASGNCLFESVRDALIGPKADYEDEDRAFAKARHDALLPQTLRRRVCEFYERLYPPQEDDPLEFKINEQFLVDQIRAVDRGISEEELTEMLYFKKEQFESTTEMIDVIVKNKVTTRTPHFKEICKNYAYASSLDAFILSLLLNVDIYTYIDNDPDGFSLTDASFRKAPTDAIFLLHTPGHYEALKPKGGNALAFKSMPPNLHPDARRVHILWPQLWDSTVEYSDSHSPMDHYHLIEHESNPKGYKSLSEKRKSRRNTAKGSPKGSPKGSKKARKK